MQPNAHLTWEKAQRSVTNVRTNMYLHLNPAFLCQRLWCAHADKISPRSLKTSESLGFSVYFFSPLQKNGNLSKLIIRAYHVSPLKVNSLNEEGSWLMLKGRSSKARSPYCFETEKNNNFCIIPDLCLLSGPQWCPLLQQVFDGTMTLFSAGSDMFEATSVTPVSGQQLRWKRGLSTCFAFQNTSRKTKVKSLYFRPVDKK